MGGWPTTNEVVRPLSTWGLWGQFAPSEKLAVYVEVKKCNFQHSGNQKSVFDNNFYWPIDTAFEEADVLDSSFIYF